MTGVVPHVVVRLPAHLLSGGVLLEEALAQPRSLEAGHVAQNVLLRAVAADLAAVPVDAFDDAAVRRVRHLPSDREPLYLVGAGGPVKD